MRIAVLALLVAAGCGGAQAASTSDAGTISLNLDDADAAIHSCDWCPDAGDVTFTTFVDGTEYVQAACDCFPRHFDGGGGFSDTYFRVYPPNGTCAHEQCEFRWICGGGALPDPCNGP